MSLSCMATFPRDATLASDGFQDDVRMQKSREPRLSRRTIRTRDHVLLDMPVPRCNPRGLARSRVGVE